MENTENINKNIDDAFKKYYKMRECISGLNEIFKINFSEKNLYYTLAMDNLKAVHDNIIEILNQIYTDRKVRIKLREIESEERDTKENFPFKLMS